MRFEMNACAAAGGGGVTKIFQAMSVPPVDQQRTKRVGWLVRSARERLMRAEQMVFLSISGIARSNK